MAAGAILPFGASSILTTRPDLGLMSCFHRGRALALSRTPRLGGLYALSAATTGRRARDHRAWRPPHHIWRRARETLIAEAGSELRFTWRQVGRLDLIQLETERLQASSRRWKPG